MEFEYKLIKASSIDDFIKLSIDAYKKNFIFIGGFSASKISGGEFIFHQQWVKKRGEETVGKIEFRIIKDTSPVEFSKKCEKAHDDDFIFTGNPIIMGAGQGKFIYLQMWYKRESEETLENEEDA